MPPRDRPHVPDRAEAFKAIRKGYCTVAEIRAAVSKTDDLFERALLKVTYYCGLRASEPGQQTVESWNPAKRTLDIVRLKGSLPHIYPLEPWVADELVKYLKTAHPRPVPSAFLFPHRLDPSEPVDRFTLGRIWRKCARRAGLPEEKHHSHILKHSIATHMLDRGDDILFVQAWLGHKRLENTQIYAELTGKRFLEGQSTVRKLMEELK